MKTILQIVIALSVSVMLFVGGMALDDHVNGVTDQEARVAPSNSDRIVTEASGILENADGSYGTATIGFYGGKVIVLTAGHCFDDLGKSATLTLTRGGLRYRLTVTCKSKDWVTDLSLATVEGLVPAWCLPSLEVEDRLVTGEPAVVVHYAIGFGQQFGRTYISNADHQPEWLWGGALFLTSPCVTGPGASGSAVWVKRGWGWKLAGVHVGGSNRYSNVAGICVHGREIRRFLDAP